MLFMQVVMYHHSFSSSSGVRNELCGVFLYNIRVVLADLD